MEIAFGLSIEEVFKRLSNRIQIEEVTYLTASLAILNKTGGNIIKVFSSIEKTLFAKKRLKLELNSLTGSSKMIVYVLFLVPIFFILFISLISPSYFEPFYTTTLGFILMGIILTIYIIYIIVVNKVMKVRM
jgi:tight adherence protein B